MEKSQPSQEAVIELGKKLVKELKLEPGVDTLGKWMAHYVAELMEKARKAKPPEKEKLQKECFETILTLWEHRYESSRVKAPLSDLGPLIKILESFKDNHIEMPLFKIREPETVTPSWQGFVDTVKNNSRDILKLCMYASVSEKVLTKPQEWLKNHESLLSQEEVSFLKALNDIINDTHIFYVDNHNHADKVKLKELDSKERYEAIFNRIEELFEESKSLLLHFKARIANSKKN